MAAKDRLVRTKRISPQEIRELDVYYDKGGMNYFNYTTKVCVRSDWR